MLKNRCLFIIIFSFVLQVSYAGDSVKNYHVQVLPSAFFTPETSWGLGASAYLYFSLDKKDTTIRKSNWQTYLSGTINKQILFENDFQVWLPQNLYCIFGSIDFTRFPELYFGRGNETKVSDATAITFDLLKIKTNIVKKLYNSTYRGLQLHYQNLGNEDIPLNNNLLCKITHGAMGYQQLGIGPIFIIDERNNALNPSKGRYLEASYLFFLDRFNNSYEFQHWLIDYRQYATLNNLFVWNGNVHIESSNGDVPFRMMPTLGGARFLRGYYRGRFRDHHSFVFQHELRRKIYKRFGISVFGGVGMVADTYSDFFSNTMHYNYGGGIRYQLHKKQDVNLRLDMGFTKDSKGIYIVYAEAF